MEYRKDDFLITTDKEKIDTDYVHRFLRNSYWAQDIPLESVNKRIQGALCFSVFHLDQQIGFARVISDEASFAYLADVFIDENFRGRGLSKWLMETIMSYPTLQNLRRFMLATRDAHGLYEKFGFRAIQNTERWMEIRSNKL